MKLDPKCLPKHAKCSLNNTVLDSFNKSIYYMYMTTRGRSYTSTLLYGISRTLPDWDSRDVLLFCRLARNTHKKMNTTTHSNTQTEAMPAAKDTESPPPPSGETRACLAENRGQIERFKIWHRL